MPDAIELLRQGRTEELWQKCCGFVDLNMEQFMGIQRRLLVEQIDLLKRCELGSKLLRGMRPRTVEEFRALVPITTYDDYVPYLTEWMEETLPAKPLLWQHTAGLRCYSGTYPFKWVPVTDKMYRELGDTCIAMLLFASCRERGHVVLEEHDKFLYGLAPPPYASGSWGRRAAEEGLFDFMPPLQDSEEMAFEERIQRGFEMGLVHGIDIMMAMSSVLVATGDRLGKGISTRSALSSLLRHGQSRQLRALLKARLTRRPLLPKDLWPLKAVVSTGTDAAVYRDRIKKLWGRYPLTVYGSTETVILATQLWDYDAMTFLPHINFLEFMPEVDCHKWRNDRSYEPRVLTLDEVTPGETYAIIATNFYGGAFVRYFLGDLVKITSLRNENLEVDIPQMLVDARVDGVIDIASFTRLSEVTIWRALENSGLQYRDWIARKEAGRDPVLHLYVELRRDPETMDGHVANVIHEELKKLDGFYADLETMLRLRPLRVTLLPRGAFRRYTERQQALGADLAHLKPPHINPSDDVVQLLLAQPS